MKNRKNDFGKEKKAIYQRVISGSLTKAEALTLLEELHRGSRGMSSVSPAKPVPPISPQEALPKPPSRSSAPAHSQIMVLSAKNEAHLRASASRLLGFLKHSDPGPELPVLAYRLQIREPMACRLAMVVTTHRMLEQKINAWLDHADRVTDVFYGTVQNRAAALMGEGREAGAFIRILVQDGKWSKLARLWVTGVAVDWKICYPGNRPPEIPTSPGPFAPLPHEIPEPSSPAIETTSGLSREFPLSEAQKALWFIYKMEPENYAYDLPSAFSIQGRLDVDKLRQVFQLLANRHEAFRTTFKMKGEEPVQVIHAGAQPDFRHEELLHFKGEARQNRVAEREPFDLENGPLLKVRLFTFSPTEHVLLFTLHHIIFDGVSFGHLINELHLAYDALISGSPLRLPPLRSSFSEFVDWQRNMLASDDGKDHEAYWVKKLGGELPILELPTDFTETDIQTFAGEVFPLELDRGLIKGLMGLARTERTSLFTVLLAAYFILLSYYSQQEDIVVGTPVAGRPESRFEPLIGYFVNMIALRGDTTGNPPFKDFLRRVRRLVLEGLHHGHYPFPTLLNRLDVHQEGSHTPVFQTVFILQNWIQDLDKGFAAPEDQVPLDTGILALEPLDWVHETGGFDLTLEITDFKEKIMAFFKYNPDLFRHDKMERMAGHFLTLLNNIIADPARPIGYLAILPKEEIAQILRGFNMTHAGFPNGKTFHELFEERAAHHPDAVAVTAGKGSLTYGRLNARANQLAHYLRQQGLRPETLVGICMDRTVEMIVALMGILKAGGAYVPLDSTYPPERLTGMIEDARPGMIVTTTVLASRLPQHDAKTVLLDSEWETIATQSTENTVSGVTPDSLVYVIFTSGSTGRPKGVMVMHRSLVNAFHAWDDAYRLSEVATSHLQMANFSFDVFSGDLARALCSGAKLVLCPREFLLEPEKLFRLMCEQKVDCAEFVPAVLRNLIGYLDETGADLRFMRLLIAGSDSWSPAEYNDFLRFCGENTRLINSYGVTEATIDSTWFEGRTAQTA